MTDFVSSRTTYRRFALDINALYNRHMDIDKMQLDIAEIPEVDENPYHPLNDRYYKDMAHAQNRVMAMQRQMKLKHVQIVKMVFAGWNYVKTAEKVGVNPMTVSKVVNGAEGQTLLQLLNYIQAAADGPTAAHRKAILYRIAVDNQENAPKVAIQAVSEINKMDMNQHLINTGNAPGTVTIIINEKTFPRTELDG